MFLTPVDREKNPDKKAWENFTMYDRGKFYAFFGTGTKNEKNLSGYPIGIDIARRKTAFTGILS